MMEFPAEMIQEGPKIPFATKDARVVSKGYHR